MTESIVCCEWRLFKCSHVSPWFFRLSLGSSRQQGSLGPSWVGKSCSCLCTSGWSSIGAMACDCYWQLGMWCFRNWANIGGMERWKRRFKPSKAGKQRIVFSFTSFLEGFVLEQLRVNKSSAFLFRSWKPPHSAPRKVVLNWRPCCNGWQPVKVNDACCTFPSSWKWDQSLWLKHEAWVLYVERRNACMYSECFCNTTTLSIPIHSPYISILFWSKSNPIAMFRCGIQLFLHVSTRSWCAWVKTCVADKSRWVSCMVLWWASRSQRRPVTSSSIWSLVTDGLGIFGDFLSTGQAHMEYQGLRRFIGDPRNMWWWSLSVLDVGVWYSESGMKQSRLHMFWAWAMCHDVPW